MKRMLIALAAAAGLSLSVASADPGGYVPPGGKGAGSFPTMSQMGGPNTLLGAGDLPPGRGPDMYGLHPCIKRFFHIQPGGRCGPGGCAGRIRWRHATRLWHGRSVIRPERPDDAGHAGVPALVVRPQPARLLYGRCEQVSSGGPGTRVPGPLHFTISRSSTAFRIASGIGAFALVL